MTRSMYDFLVEKNCGMTKEAGLNAGNALLRTLVKGRRAARAAGKGISDLDAAFVSSIKKGGMKGLRHPGVKNDLQYIDQVVNHGAAARPGEGLSAFIARHPRALANTAYGAAGLGAAGLGVGGYAAYKGLAGNEEEAAIVDQALADPEVAQAVQKDPSILDQIVSFAKDNAGAVAGGLGGAGLGALTAAAMSKDNKLRNAAIAGILSGAVGAMGGAAYDRYGRK